MKQGVWKQNCKGTIQLFWNCLERKFDYYGNFNSRTIKINRWRNEIANLPGIWSIVITPEIESQGFFNSKYSNLFIIKLAENLIYKGYVQMFTFFQKIYIYIYIYIFF